MSRKILSFVVGFGLAFAASGEARASSENYFTMQGTEVVLADAEVWDVYPAGSKEPPSDYDGLIHGTGFQVPRPAVKGKRHVVIPYSFAVTCPDVDEHVSQIQYGVEGRPLTVVDYGESLEQKGDTRAISDSVRVTWYDLYKLANQDLLSGFGISIVVKRWCSPLVGKDTVRTVVHRRTLHVQFQPEEVWSRSRPSEFMHACPGGYELIDGSEYGYGQQSGYSRWNYEDCRRIDQAKVEPPKEPPPPAPKSAEQIAVEKYHLAIAQAGQAQSVFHKAGIQTIYDLAHTPLANLTSVLGVQQGKKVRKAAIERSGASGILDPNWRFDVHFLVDPTWFVDPRLRGTAGAQKKIGKGQKELSKLQKAGIVTLHQLAKADPAFVGSKTGGGAARGEALVAAAKKKTRYASAMPWEMAVQRDWVIHPAWMVDPGYLPSAKVVRNQKVPAPTSTGVTVTVTTPKNPGIVPPSHNVDPKAKPDRSRATQKLPGSTKIDPLGLNPSRARKPRRSVGRGRVVSTGRQGGKKKKKKGAGRRGAGNRGGGGIPESRRGGQGGGGRGRGGGGQGSGGIPEAGSGSARGSSGGGGRKGKRRQR